MSAEVKGMTVERLRAMVDYDPETGVFRWKVRRADRQVGAIAGVKTVRGYWLLRLYARHHLAHRLAWAYVHGRWPVGDIDHINGDKLDNRIVNLREATRAVNTQNVRRARSSSKSGLLGAWYDAERRRWRSCIRTNGVRVDLGSFGSAAEAHCAYVAAKRRLHPGCTMEERMLVAPGIGADEVKRALRGSGLVVVPGEGCATIQREMTPTGAA